MEELGGSILMFVIGSAFAIVGIHIRKNRKKLAENGIKTKAEILEYIEEKGSKYTYYFPKYRFELKDGTSVTQKGNFGTSWKSLKTEDTIYYIKNEGEISIVSETELQNSGLINIFIGLGLVLILLALAIFSKRFFLAISFI